MRQLPRSSVNALRRAAPGTERIIIVCVNFDATSQSVSPQLPASFCTRPTLTAGNESLLVVWRKGAGSTSAREKRAVNASALHLQYLKIRVPP